ncbi:MAG: hypothetical protein ACRD4P_15750 [Bryobacteraceae bacterium]
MTLAAAWTLVAHAQIQDFAEAETTSPPPYALFQYSTLTGSGNTVTATWVPVVTATGSTIYKNMTLQFNVDLAGNLTIASGYPKVVPAPPPIVSSFRAGRYVGPSTVLSGEAIINVAGPGITAGGATEWSLASAAGASACTYPGTATWYVGPLASSPLAARLKKIGITSTAWSYGVGGDACSGAWRTNTLLGFSQVGNTLTIVSFTYGGVDNPEPLDQITYTLAPK